MRFHVRIAKQGPVLGDRINSSSGRPDRRIKTRQFVSQRRGIFSCTHIPHFQLAIGPSRHQLRVIRVKRQTEHLSRMRLQLSGFLAGGHVPQSDQLIPSGRRQRRPVSRQGHGKNGIIMRVPRPHHLARRRVQHPNHTLLRRQSVSQQDMTPVRQSLHRCDPVGQPGNHLPPGYQSIRLPNHQPAKSARDQTPAVRHPRHRLHRIKMRPSLAPQHQRLRRHVKHHHFRAAPRRQPPAVRRKRHRHHRTISVRQGSQRHLTDHRIRRRRCIPSQCLRIPRRSTPQPLRQHPHLLDTQLFLRRHVRVGLRRQTRQ